MSVQRSSPNTLFTPQNNQSFRTAGLVFAGLGVLAMLLPNVATVVVEQLVAWVLVLWGAAGLFFARSFRAFSEWRIVAIGFACVLAAGLWFLFFPGAGATFMTAVLVVTFLLEGVLTILLGLRMSGQIANWVWMVASGASAFVLGLIVLMQWPQDTGWLIGFMVGLNFLTTGIALLVMSRTTKENK